MFLLQLNIKTDMQIEKPEDTYQETFETQVGGRAASGRQAGSKGRQAGRQEPARKPASQPAALAVQAGGEDTPPSIAASTQDLLQAVPRWEHPAAPCITHRHLALLRPLLLQANGDWTTVHLPWHSFVLVKRARSVPDYPPLDPARIRQFGLVLSR